MYYARKGIIRYGHVKGYIALFVSMILGFASPIANAHVKWFTAYDLYSPPRPVLTVLQNQQFLAFGAITTLFLCLLLLTLIVI